jgi:dissimilatory sulfite reductase related protein
METLSVRGKTLVLDADGNLANRSDWTEEIARDLAVLEGIPELTSDHWKVIKFMRKVSDEEGDAPSIRRLTKESGVDTKTLYQLFPKGPAKKAARIAGLPKPKGCI